jgi:hypothetical protein
MLAVAVELDDVAGLLAMLAAVLTEGAALLNGAVARGVRTLVGIHDRSS